MTSERQTRSRGRRSQKDIARDEAAAEAEAEAHAADAAEAEADAAEAEADAAEAETDAAEAEAEAAELAANAESPDDDPEVAARKAQRRAELEAERQAKLAKQKEKAERREANQAEKARRAAAREEREKRNEKIRAERAAKFAAIEQAQKEREAKLAALAEERRRRAEELELASRRRPLTPEEQAEARAYAQSEAPEKPSPWKFQLQVIKALVLRDMGSRFGTRSRLSYIWALLNPILLMLGLIIVFSLKSRVAPPNLPLMAFVITGYPMWFAFYGMWGEVSRADDDPSMLMFPQVTVFDLIIARIVLEAATATVVFVLLIAGAIIVGRAPFPDQPGNLLFSYWAAIWLGSAFGLLICSIRRFMPMFEEWLMPVRRLGIFISGVIFTAATLPSWTLPYFSWNPLFRTIEIARESWHPAYQSPIADPGYVFFCCFGLTAVAIVAERLTRRYAGE
jgi:capsular polysaccharide transport system permease protein